MYAESMVCEPALHRMSSKSDMSVQVCVDGEKTIPVSVMTSEGEAATVGTG